MYKRPKTKDRRPKAIMRTGLSVFCFLVSLVYPLFCFSQSNFVNPNSYDHTPYSKTMPESLDDYAALPYLLNTGVRQIASQNPSVIIDKDGNRRVYLDGKLKLMIEKDGDMTLFSKGQKYCLKTPDHRLIKSFDWDNRGRAAVSNEWGERLGYEQYRLGGKIVSKADSRQNTTHQYDYDERGTGYWEYSLATQAWRRHELDRPVYERMNSKDGEITAYWREDGDNLWRVEKTTVFGRDEQGAGIDCRDKLGRRRIVDGDRTKYNKSGDEPLATYDREGNLKISYVWEAGRLRKVTNHINGAYEKYGEFGVVEEGVFNRAGEEFAAWQHEWQGSRHQRAYELMLHPLTGKPVRSGKYKNYTAEGDVDALRVGVNEINKNWWSQLYAESGLDAPRLGDDILLEDYVYFDEVSNLSPPQLKDFFNTTDYFAQTLYGDIQEYKGKGKAAAGLFAILAYDLPEDAAAGSARYLVHFTIFDENNMQGPSVQAVDSTYVSAAAKVLKVEAQEYLEAGDYDNALAYCGKFEQSYVKGLEDFDNALGRLYLKVLNIEKQALQRLGRLDEAAEVSNFIAEKFGDLALGWGPEYAALVE